MSQKIFKYELPETISILELPHGAKVLSAHSQVNGVGTKDEGEERVYIWAQIDTEAGVGRRRIFEVMPTGDGYTDALREFIGTVHFTTTRLVFHVFELRE